MVPVLGLTYVTSKQSISFRPIWSFLTLKVDLVGGERGPQSHLERQLEAIASLLLAVVQAFVNQHAER